MSNHELPVLIVGAGPVGLAAAVHLKARGLEPLVLEAGSRVGHAVRQWGHVRMFSPWRYNIDPMAAQWLAAVGWTAPAPESFPTGAELARDYLDPLAALPALAPHIVLDARVVAVSRRGRDRMKNAERASAPFVVRYRHQGEEREVLARAVIDASGTLATPSPAGASGLPALGEATLGERVRYGLPDIAGADRDRHAGRRTLVIGSGHSAFNALADLARLAEQVTGTSIYWAVRRPSLRRVLGGGDNDQLAERGALGLRIERLVAHGRVQLHTGVLIERFVATAGGVCVESEDGRRLPPVDAVIVATGFRPDLGLSAELRLDLDPGTQAPSVLAPLIDPNLHSCGTVRPHGALELKHPEPDFYVVGMKSYGRAPTFLLLTGYEQVRSVAAALVGDWEAARRVELRLPETGVCSVQFAEEESGAAAALAQGCCGGPAPATAIDACCMADAQALNAGAAGCGCGSEAPAVLAERQSRPGGCGSVADGAPSCAG